MRPTGTEIGKLGAFERLGRMVYGLAAEKEGRALAARQPRAKGATRTMPPKPRPPRIHLVVKVGPDAMRLELQDHQGRQIGTAMSDSTGNATLDAMADDMIYNIVTDYLLEKAK